MGVEAMTKPREPAGEIKRSEDAATTGQAWNLLLDLEDVDFLHEQDKLSLRDFVTKAVERIKEARQPCSRWDNLFNRRGCL